MKSCPHCGSYYEKETKKLPDFEESDDDDTDLKSSVLDELISLMDGHASKKLESFKKPKSVSVEVLSLGKKKDEDDDEEEV